MEEILDLTQNGAKKTEILYQSNTNFAQLEQYLELMLEKQLLKVTQVKNHSGSNSRIYVTTKKGTDFIKDIERAYSYLK
jgi:predicted transcriptional regulator